MRLADCCRRRWKAAIKSCNKRSGSAGGLSLEDSSKSTNKLFTLGSSNSAKQAREIGALASLRESQAGQVNLPHHGRLDFADGNQRFDAGNVLGLGENHFEQQPIAGREVGQPDRLFRGGARRRILRRRLAGPGRATQRDEPCAKLFFGQAELPRDAAEHLLLAQQDGSRSIARRG